MEDNLLVQESPKTLHSHAICVSSSSNRILLLASRMKKPAPIEITIPGRRHCRKTVVDFSRMTAVIFLLAAFAEIAIGQVKRNKPAELHPLQKPNYAPKLLQYTIDTTRVSLRVIRDSADAVIQNKLFTDPYSHGGGISVDGDGRQRKFIIDGIPLNPPGVVYKSIDSQRTASMEAPGRKTIKGDDLPHSFRIGED